MDPAKFDFNVKLADGMRTQVTNELDSPFTTYEVVKQVKFLNKRKACGLDNILNEFIKITPHVCYEMFTIYFDVILQGVCK